MVDIGALRASGGSDSGDEQPKPPIIGDVRRSQRLYQAHAATTRPPIPKTYKEAINDPIYGAYWKQATREELAKLQALNTWKEVPLPPGKKAIGYKWVFTVKYTPTGLIDCFKARLVCLGYSQTPGDNFLETFSPTIRAESLRILLALGACEDLEIR
jgi:hypothetical protein